MAVVQIIDDSPTEVHVFKTVLEGAGFNVIVAVNAEDGLAMAKNDKPDLILMDVVMPGMNGFQATRQLSKDPGTASIPIIMITTKDQETDKIWGMRQGAKDYIVKPVDPADLLDRVKTLLTA
ncbi:MAG: twitching motility response regulator PilH [Gammaproteobacteria bacterium]|nr:twitching motility response regulator PilH [Gammaproteobacteria bacterium]